MGPTVVLHTLYTTEYNQLTIREGPLDLMPVLRPESAASRRSRGVSTPVDAATVARMRASTESCHWHLLSGVLKRFVFRKCQPSLVRWGHSDTA